MCLSLYFYEYLYDVYVICGCREHHSPLPFDKNLVAKKASALAFEGKQPEEGETTIILRKPTGCQFCMRYCVIKIEIGFQRNQDNI